MRQQEKHVREGYSFARLMGDPSFVVEPIIQVLPPLDSGTIYTAQSSVQLVQIHALHDIWSPSRCQGQVYGSPCHDARDAEFGRIYADLEYPAQFLPHVKIRVHGRRYEQHLRQRKVQTGPFPSIPSLGWHTAPIPS